MTKIKNVLQIVTEISNNYDHFKNDLEINDIGIMIEYVINMNDIYLNDEDIENLTTYLGSII